ncbi:hypothetical protein [Pontibacillus salipaludis]|uniref:Uncharacterized protein n=1 Tax=Pontibacillus salipaludis TaxID=1697394 RepID=A0ABQ1QJ37_9BACI|nr:hypothetical protein [Pontibacillus salipaludis]GGD28993.1 hypothetical protein GCM10011389_40730 [Pontibacillus salipaludis]
MANLITQDMTVLVTPTSRYNGNQFDEVYVRTTIVSDGEIKAKYYVPNGSSLSNAALNLIQSEGLEFRPYLAEELLEGTNNIQESAKTGDPVDTVSDAAKLILLSALEIKTLEEVAKLESGKRVYNLEYKYKIFSEESNPNHYQFHVKLPFDGIEMANGTLKLTVVTPDKAKVNQTETKGTDDQNREIKEVVNELRQTGKSVTEFTYRRDPDFIVRYEYDANTELK